MAKAKIKNIKIHDTKADQALDIVTGAILVFLILIVGYPIIYVISSSCLVGVASHILFLNASKFIFASVLNRYYLYFHLYISIYLLSNF